MEQTIRKDKKATSFQFKDAPDGIYDILKNDSRFSWVVIGAGRDRFHSGDKDSSFNCVSIFFDEEGVQVELLHPTADPAFESEHWDLFYEILDLFGDCELVSSYDWREGAWPDERAEIEEKEAARRKGRFHVRSLPHDGESFGDERVVLITDNPVEAYEAFVELPEVKNHRQYHYTMCRSVIRDTEKDRYFRFDTVLRSCGSANTPSSFEEEMFIRPYDRCGNSYRVGKYTYCRRDYWNLMTGKSWMACPGDRQGAPLISKAEKTAFDEMKWPDYPVVPMMSDGSRVEVGRPKPSKYWYTEPYSEKRYPVYPAEVNELPEQTLEELREMIPLLREGVVKRHALSINSRDMFQSYVTCCAALEKNTGEDLYRPIAIPA